MSGTAMNKCERDSQSVMSEHVKNETKHQQ